MDDLSSSLSSLSTTVSVSSSNGHLTLDKLHYDIHHFYLFKYFHLDELWNFRLISKEFYSIVKSYDITELSFLPNDFYFKDNWFPTAKLIKLSNQLPLSKLSVLKNPSRNLLNLKYLSINNYQPPFDYEVLNKFTKLQVLMIDGLQISSHDNLQLPKLKALSLSFDKAKPGSLEFDSPNLHSLNINWDFQSDSIVNIKFKHLNPIKFIKVVYFYPSLLVFENLECFEFYSYKINLGIHVDLLKFNKLNKLRIPFIHMNNQQNDLDRLRDVFSLKSKGLQIVLGGVKLKQIGDIDKYWKRESDLKYQLDNYAELEDNLNFAIDISYNDLISFLPNQPSNLFKKYNNIQELSIFKKIKDERRLLIFIKECHILCYLLVDRSSLKQNFFDQLPLISSLFVLIIENVDVRLDCEFIMKMPYLKLFQIDQDLLATKSLNLNHLKLLKRFQFRMQIFFEAFIVIDVLKDDNDKYRIYKNSRNISVTERLFTFKQLVRQCDELRNTNFLMEKKFYDYYATLNIND